MKEENWYYTLLFLFIIFIGLLYVLLSGTAFARFGRAGVAVAYGVFSVIAILMAYIIESIICGFSRVLVCISLVFEIFFILLGFLIIFV